MRTDCGAPQPGHAVRGGLSRARFVDVPRPARLPTEPALRCESAPHGRLGVHLDPLLPLADGPIRARGWQHATARGFADLAIPQADFVAPDARRQRIGLLVSIVAGHKIRRAPAREEESDER